MFKTILSVIGTAQAERDLKIAIGLCGETGAHLSALVAAMAPPPGGRYATLAPSWLEARERDRTELAANVAQLRERLAEADISFDIDGIYAEVAGTGYDIGERALYADLVLLGPGACEDEDLKHQVVSGAIFQAGRPLLVGAPLRPTTLRPRRILLAWNSRAQAAHAVRDALALMKAAETVRVTMVDPVPGLRASGGEPGADVATYLARHGVNVTVDTLPGTRRTVADALQKHAVDMDADLIVMGAYGHSRMRELVFGGATRSMLGNTNFPVLMAH